MSGLASYSQVGRELGVHPKTIADLTRLLGIVPAHNPSSPKHLGLTRADQAKIRKVLRFPAKAS